MRPADRLGFIALPSRRHMSPHGTGSRVRATVIEYGGRSIVGAARGTTKPAAGSRSGCGWIGWVALQAYKLTHERGYLRMARDAADWLFDNTLDERGGKGWVEDVHRPLVHTSLDNGAPGSPGSCTTSRALPAIATTRRRHPTPSGG